MPQPRTPTLKVTQLLVVFLMAGLVLFAAVVIGLNLSGSMKPAAQTAPGQMNVMLMALAGMFAAQLPVFFLVPTMLTKGFSPKWAAASSDEAREAVVLGALQIITIVRCALVEGVGMFGVVIYFLQGDVIALIAPGLAVVAMAAIFPTRGRKEALAARLALPR